MPLASKDGKLYVKTEIDENGNEVQKLCTSCCDDTELGCCYVDIGDGTLQSQGRTTKSDCQASQDEVDPSIDCVWIADTEETKDQPCPDQPVYPSTPGICLYRKDGQGTCTQYYVEGSGGGDCGDDSPEECYENQVGPHLEGSFPPGNGTYYFYYGVDGDEDSLYWEAFTVTGEGPSGEYPATESDCIENAYYDCSVSPLPEGAFTLGGSSMTCEEYAEQVNSLAPSTWENDLPADDCRPVSSEEECTESTGTFCPDLTECPDDPSAGCPDTPNRSNPLP